MMISDTLKYNQVFVLLEDCLVSVKSGLRSPKNIADFIPDYNLWYALKFLGPPEIIVIENLDLSINSQSSWFDLKIRFISEWLSEVAGVKVKSGYSYHGDWKFLYGYPNDKELLDHFRKPGKILFIDRNNAKNRKYVREKKEIDYMSKEEFILKYNKNPRVYEKK